MSAVLEGLLPQQVKNRLEVLKERKELATPKGGHSPCNYCVKGGLEGAQNLGLSHPSLEFAAPEMLG